MDIFSLCLGIFIGIVPTIIYLFKHKSKYIIGSLIINTSNANKDIYRFEFNDLQKLEKRSYVYLKIKRES